MTERWISITGYETLYAVSDLGRVMSLRNGRALKPLHVSDGYLAVKLHRADRGTSASIHRLVCAAFHGAPEAGQQAAHLDGNRENNRADNLKWVSPKENTAHKREHGTHQAGERHPRAKLTAEQVAEIRRSGETARELAERFGMHPVSIRQIRSGRRWSEASQSGLKGIAQTPGETP